MAKVALITETYSGLIESLATALTHQKQEVTIITSRNCLELIPSHLHALGPFRKWTPMEAARAIPTLISQNFDVWHFLFPTSESQPKAAHWILGSLAKGLPQKIVVASFTSSDSLRGLNSRFLRLLDLALFSNRSFLMQAKRRDWLPPKTLAEVLPPLEGAATAGDGKIRDEIHRLMRGLRPFLVLPDFQDGPTWIDQSPVDLVVMKPQPRKGPRHRHVFYTGDLSVAERELLIKQSLALCLLYGDYSDLELQRFHQWSEQSMRPLIVRGHQTETWPGLCWHLKSGWVMGDGPDPLRDLLTENPDLTLPGGYQNYTRRELVDSTLNQLLRLYQKSFAQRWT